MNEKLKAMLERQGYFINGNRIRRNNKLKATLATFGSLIALALFGDFCFHYPKISFYIFCAFGVFVIVWVLYVAFLESFENRWRRLDQQGVLNRRRSSQSDDL